MQILKAVVAIVAVGVAGYFVYNVLQMRQTAALNNRATNLIERGQYAEARDLLERARSRHPNNPVVWKNLGAAYEGLKEIGKATQAYERSLALNPSQNEVRDNLAILQKAIAVENQRLAKLQSQLPDKPDDASLLARIGMTYDNLGDSTRAIEMFERSLKANPNQPEIQKRLDELREK